MGVVDVDVHISNHLDELAWAVDKRLRVISTYHNVIKNSKGTKELKNKAVLNLKQYCSYTLLCSP